MLDSVGVITLSHGAGGRDMRRLLDTLILPTLSNGQHQSSDAASFDWQCVAGDQRLVFTSDSFTVSPRHFPGGDLGSLAVYGTVNDLATAGATPLYLSCSLIIEEGLPIEELQYLLTSMRRAADASDIAIVTGDTKVVPRGGVDGLFINTAGIGAAAPELQLGKTQITEQDRIIVSGPIGDHGVAILCARGDLKLESSVESDCRPIHQYSLALLDACPETRVIRDATRGGVATVISEIVQGRGLGAWLDESSLPVRQGVRSACELLGFDPLWLANEGTFVAVVPERDCETALNALRAFPACKYACAIGGFTQQYTDSVALRTRFGGERSLDVPSGELLPRIC